MRVLLLAPWLLSNSQNDLSRSRGGDNYPETWGGHRRDGLWRVLNAFRHHGADRTTATLPIPVGALCSTPSGITAPIAWHDSSCRNPAFGAQRLPASRRRSLA